VDPWLMDLESLLGHLTTLARFATWRGSEPGYMARCLTQLWST
jgi:hypothetical protein